MRSFTVIGTLILLILSTACTTTGDGITSPTGTDLLNTGKGLDNSVDECRTIMMIISSQAVIFYACNGTYPNTLEELDLAGIVCPGCGLPHQMVGTDTDFFVTCPIPSLPNHGSMLNGVSSWNQTFVDECRATMRTIASQCVIFYAINGTYPADMEELGEPYSEMTCPECGEHYNLKGDTEHFALDCPLPPVISHGSIVDGIVSWIGEPGNGQDACRANMRTIASQCVIFYALNSRYPKTLEEMGMAGVVCPGCCLDYQLIGTETDFYIGCPLPSDPSHGFIDNGISSW